MHTHPGRIIYFILIKTTANSLEEFKANKKQEGNTVSENVGTNKKDIRLSLLSEEHYGWYRGTITFKRVILIPGTNKFQYQDTTFSALTKASSGQECYNRIIAHLKSREDIDLRSQLPSAKGNSFDFKFIKEL